MNKVSCLIRIVFICAILSNPIFAHAGIDICPEPSAENPIVCL